MSSTLEELMQTQITSNALPRHRSARGRGLKRITQFNHGRYIAAPNLRKLQ